MDFLLTAIRRDPLAYLPEVSLSAFHHFLTGYVLRCAMEGKPHNWQYNGRNFWEWLEGRFKLEGSPTIGYVGIVSSFSCSDAEAFHKYFELLDEFFQEGRQGTHQTSGKAEYKTLAGMVIAIRERPALYLGHASFRAFHSYMTGDEYACRDLQVPTDEGRSIFEAFKRWVETEKNRALPRPWFKVIEFWGGGIDCGHNPKSGAFSLCFHWIDEFAEKIGKPDMFRVIVKPAEEQASTG